MDRSKWEYKKLGEVCTIIGRIGFRGYTKADFVNNPEEGAITLSPSNIVKGEMDFSNCSYITWQKYEESPEIKIYPGDILLVKTASVGKTALVKSLPHEATINPQFVVLKNIVINNHYLSYCLKSNKAQDYILSMAKGAVAQTVTQRNLAEMQLAVPSIEDQQRIVTELDCLNEMIAVKQEQLKEFDKLAQSIFFDMFGDPSHNEKQWKLKSLKDISNEKLSYGSGASAVTFDGRTRYIRITDINDNGELNEDIVSPSVYDEKYLLNDGDILFARSGATVGKTYCYNSKYGQCIYAGYLIRLVPNKELVLPSYVFSYTKTPYYRSFVEAAQRAVAQPNINAKQYGDLLICVPPLSLQQQFAEKISAIEAQKELVKQSIAETQSLFNSRMDYFFN